MAIDQTKSLKKEIQSKDRQHQLDIRAIGRDYRRAMEAKDREQKVENNNMVATITTLTKDLKVSVHAYSCSTILTLTLSFYVVAASSTTELEHHCRA